MKLLYFNEHLSCINYHINVITGFDYYNLEKDSESKIDNS
ncbi:AraC family transcriptional regulator, partial [Bacteroides fragilis]